MLIQNADHLPSGEHTLVMDHLGVSWEAHQINQDYYDAELVSIVNAKFPAGAALIATDDSDIQP